MIVADFGLARIVSQATNSARRMSPKGPLGSGRRQERKKRYTVVGNPYWMAPEMMKGNKYDEKVDIFSFGIVLCEVILKFLLNITKFFLNECVFFLFIYLFRLLEGYKPIQIFSQDPTISD